MSTSPPMFYIPVRKWKKKGIDFAIAKHMVASRAPEMPSIIKWIATSPYYWTTLLHSERKKTVGPNNNSVRGLKVVDDIKAMMESVYAGVVSCVDTLAIAAPDSVVILGGPTWDVKVGRKDSRTASLSAANSGVIPPPTSTLSNLINRFQARGLPSRDMVGYDYSFKLQDFGKDFEVFVVIEFIEVCFCSN